MRPAKSCRKPVAALAAAALMLAACGQGGVAGGPGAGQKAGGGAQSADPGAAQAQEMLEALGGAASAPARAQYEGEFQAYGALDALGAGEGAWELSLFEGYAQFTRPGLGEDGGPTQAREFRERGMWVAAGPLTITLRADACPLPNGESLPYVANVLFDGIVYQGCARRGVESAARPTWASFIGELIPAIDACLGRAGGRGVRVTTASALPDGVVSVRLRSRDGGRNVCVAAADGARVVAYEPILDTDRLGGEGDPEFVRAASEDAAAPAAEQCRSVNEARSSEGALLGWLLPETC